MRVKLVSGQDAPYGYRVPCGFLLVALDGRGEPTFRPGTTWWARGEWDFFGLARAFGYPWTWDEHDDSTAAVSEAYDFLIAHTGEIAEVDIEAIAQGLPRPGCAALAQGTGKEMPCESARRP